MREFADFAGYTAEPAPIALDISRKKRHQRNSPRLSTYQLSAYQIPGATMAESSHTPCSRYVDMWALPGMHPSNVELLQQLTTADTNHFNKHMDVVGTVSEQDADSGDWEKTHIVGLRSDVWKIDTEELEEALEVLHRKRRRDLKKKVKRSGRLDAKQRAQLAAVVEDDAVMQLQSDQIETRRLVIKLFKTTGSRTRWCGTLEELTATEIHNSIGSKRNLLSMAVLLPRHEYVTYLQQNHRTFRIPSLFTGGFVDEDRMWHLSLKRHWLSLGADFAVEIDGQEIGKVDGKLFSFGSDSHLSIADHPLCECTQFVDLLTLFAASVGYHDAMRRSIGRRVDAVLAGQSFRHLIEDEELRLRQNGRAAA